MEKEKWRHAIMGWSNKYINNVMCEEEWLIKLRVLSRHSCHDPLRPSRRGRLIFECKKPLDEVVPEVPEEDVPLVRTVSERSSVAS